MASPFDNQVHVPIDTYISVIFKNADLYTSRQVLERSLILTKLNDPSTSIPLEFKSARKLDNGDMLFRFKPMADLNKETDYILKSYTKGLPTGRFRTGSYKSNEADEFPLVPASINGIGSSRVMEFDRFGKVEEQVSLMNEQLTATSFLIPTTMAEQGLIRVKFNDRIHPASLASAVRVFEVSANGAAFNEVTSQLEVGYRPNANRSSMNEIIIQGKDAAGLSRGQYIMILDLPRKFNSDGSMGVYPETRTAAKFHVDQAALTKGANSELTKMIPSNVTSSNGSMAQIKMPDNESFADEDYKLREAVLTSRMKGVLEIGTHSPNAILEFKVDKEIDPQSLSAVSVFSLDNTGKLQYRVGGTAVTLKDSHTILIAPPEGGHNRGEYAAIIAPSLKTKHPELSFLNDQFIEGNTAFINFFTVGD